MGLTESADFGWHAGCLLGGRAAGAAEYLRTQRAVRQQVDDIRAGCIFVQLLKIPGDIDMAAAAVAGDECCAALRQIARGVARLGREDAAIAVVVQIDEAGANDESLAIDRAADLDVADFAHGDDAIATNGNIALHWLIAGTINDRAALEQDVDFQRLG